MVKCFFLPLFLLKSSFCLILLVIETLSFPVQIHSWPFYSSLVISSHWSWLAIFLPWCLPLSYFWIAVMTLLSLCLVKLKKAGYSGLPERNVPYSDYPTSLRQSLAFFYNTHVLKINMCVLKRGPHNTLCVLAGSPRFWTVLNSFAHHKSHMWFSVNTCFCFLNQNPNHHSVNAKANSCLCRVRNGV